MKKLVCLIMILIMCIGTARAEFDDNSFSSMTHFICDSEYFTYYALSSLWEMDNETGEALDYPECECDYLIEAREDGTIVYVDAFGQLVVTDLYGTAEEIALADASILHMSVYDGCLYYFTSDKSISVINLTTYTRKTVLADDDIWVRFLLVDGDGIWYSDDTGLYLLPHGENTPQKIIDSDVSCFQRIDDEIFYAASTSGEIRVFSLIDKTEHSFLKQTVYSFAIDHDKQHVLLISRPGFKAIWCDISHETRTQLGLQKGEQPMAINCLNGQPYIRTMLDSRDETGRNLCAVYRICEGELIPVYKEAEE